MAIALGGASDHRRPAEHAQHLASCPKCVAFDRQLSFITEAARCACAAFAAEPAPDFESRILRRLYS